MKKDELGERMKENYENRTRLFLPRRTYTIIRLDGKAFHTYTKGFHRPYDLELMSLMDDTAVALCEGIQGALMAYVQSDEISILLTDFDTIHTDAWFDGNIQKIVSVSASMATAAFNGLVLHNIANKALQGDSKAKIDLAAAHANCLKPAYFDSRTFSIPDRNEVFNYFIWRQQDATRNSIQMGAQSLYSQKQLNGKNTSELQELMFQKGVNWDKYPAGFKRGRMILKNKKEEIEIPEKHEGFGGTSTVTRMRWQSNEPPVFTKAPGWLRGYTPVLASPITLGEKDLIETP